MQKPRSANLKDRLTVTLTLSVAAGLLCTALVGCGQKGPLVLPSAQPKHRSIPRAPKPATGSAHPAAAPNDTPTSRTSRTSPTAPTSPDAPAPAPAPATTPPLR